MQSISIFLDITAIADFWLKSSDDSRTQAVCKVIYIFFGSFSGEI